MLTCLATPPKSPAVRFAERASATSEAKPATPIVRSSKGRKKRNSRNASALLITDPAARRSLRKVPTTTSTTGTPSYLASHCWALVTPPRVAATNLARPVSSAAPSAALSPASPDAAPRCGRSRLADFRRRTVMDSPKHPDGNQDPTRSHRSRRSATDPPEEGSRYFVLPRFR